MTLLIARRKFYRFRTRMIAIMLATMALVVAVLVGLHYFSVRTVNQHIVETTTELLNIIQIAETKIPTGETYQEAMEKYIQELKGHGVSVRIVDATGDNSVIASTNPKEVGKIIQPKKGLKKKGPFRIYGRVGDDDDDTLSQGPYKITFPVVQGEQVIGYSILDMPLDDFKKLLDQIYLHRLLTTLGILCIGAFSTIYLAVRFTRPINDLVAAAREVAAGNLNFSIPIKLNDEIGTLSATFNEMIEKLRESRKLEERLYQVEKQSTVGRLAAGIAHEIRNPLNYISLSIDHVKTKYQPEGPREVEEYQKTLDNIKDEISRLKKMVNEFLEFGRPTKLMLQPWPLHSILSDALKLLERKMEAQQVEVKLNVLSNGAPLMVDHEQIKTCLMNILINCLEAMPSGGTLTISAVEDTDQEIMHLTIADSGSGIAEDVQAKVFEPYFSTKETGVGLGLAITKKTIEDHGGKITLKSVVNQGTTIFVELPLAAEQPLVPAA